MSAHHAPKELPATAGADRFPFGPLPPWASLLLLVLAVDAPEHLERVCRAIAGV